METTIYLHSRKESMYERGVELGLKGEALEYFRFACYQLIKILELPK